MAALNLAGEYTVVKQFTALPLTLSSNVTDIMSKSFDVGGLIIVEKGVIDDNGTEGYYFTNNGVKYALPSPLEESLKLATPVVADSTKKYLGMSKNTAIVVGLSILVIGGFIYYKKFYKKIKK